MKTDYKDYWPASTDAIEKRPVFDESTPAQSATRDFVLRIGQLKYDLRQSQTTVRTLEWISFIEFVIIVALVAVCVS